MSSTSGVTRITGLSSGLDIDTYVENLMTAEKTKYNSLEQSKQKIAWQQEAYRSVISKLQTFQDTYFGSVASSTNLRYSTAFNQYANTVTDKNGNTSGAITVNYSSLEGSYKVQVDQLATNNKYTTNAGTIKSSITSSKTISDIETAVNENSDENDDSAGLSFNITYDGTTKKITLSKKAIEEANGSVTDAINSQLNNYFGVTKDDNGDEVGKVSVSDANGYLQFNVNVDGGAGHTLEINESATNANATKNIELSSDAFEDGKLTKAVNTTLSLTVGDTDYTINLDLEEGASTSDIVSAINEQLKNDEDLSGLSDKISFAISKDSSSGNYNFTITNLSSDEDITVSSSGLLSEISDTDEDVSLRHTSDLTDLGLKSGESSSISKTDILSDVFSEDLLSQLTYNTDGEEGDFTITINGVDITANTGDTITQFMNKINASDAGVTMKFNSVTKSFSLEANDSGEVNKITDLDTGNSGLLFGANGFGFTETVTAQDAKFSIDGISTSRASNDIDLDGIKITLNAVTDGETTVESKQDVSAITSLIKSFVEDYNTLISDLNTSVTETRSKSGTYTYYEPLTSDQKEEMDDDEIEKWETEAKKGILYNSSEIKDILSKMRSALYKQITTSDGQKMSLYSIGITTTSDYTQGGKLEIDEEKLEEALRTNANAVQEMFTQSSTGLADSMKTITNSAIGTNGTLRNKAGIEGTASATDNVLTKKYNEIVEQMEKELERLSDKEDYYYELFSNMETAINNNNTQLDTLTSMLSS
jgi:flagellar hook-associated protein 2